MEAHRFCGRKHADKGKGEMESRRKGRNGGALKVGAPPFRQKVRVGAWAGEWGRHLSEGWGTGAHVGERGHRAGRGLREACSARESDGLKRAHVREGDARYRGRGGGLETQAAGEAP